MTRRGSLVISGCLRTVHFQEDGLRKVGIFSFPGDLVGWEATGQHEAGVETTIATSCRRFARRELDALADRDRSVARWLRALAAQQLRAGQQHLARIGCMTAFERLASFLVAIALPMCRRDIADYLCMTVEAVSRVMARLARNCLVSSGRNHFAIYNRAALHGLAGVASPHYAAVSISPVPVVARRAWDVPPYLTALRQPQLPRGSSSAVHAVG